MDKKAYEKHKRRVNNVEPKIDNKAPKLNTSLYYNTGKLLQYMNRMRQLDKENIELLRQMNIITRMGGKVDCWLPKINYSSSLPDPNIRNRQIMAQNKMFLQRLVHAASKYPTSEFIQSWKNMKKATHHGNRYVQTPVARINVSLPSHKDHCMVKDLSLLEEMNPSIRTKCFFDIEIQGENQKLGCILFELYDDIVPRTCANFVELCRGVNGLSYKNTPFHRIVSGYWCQGGDVTKFNGIGGTSVYGETFENENYKLRHGGPGILSTTATSENTSNSKFNLTFKRLETVDGTHVVFGKVIGGLSNIYKIEEFGTKTGKPFKTVIVSDCGIMSKTEKNRRKSK